MINCTEMEHDEINVGEFIFAKLSNLINFLEAELSTEHPEIKVGLDAFRKDLEATSVERRVGYTLMAVRTLAPNGYLPDNEESIAWLKKIMEQVKNALVKMITDEEQQKRASLLCHSFDDQIYHRFILYINMFSEILMPEIYAEALKKYGQ